MFPFQQRTGFLQIHEVTFPICRYLYWNLSCTLKNVLTSSVYGIEIAIENQLLWNLFNHQMMVSIFILTITMTSTI